MIKILLLITLLFSPSFPNIKIAIDIGHSKKNGGALSARGISEYHYNRMVALSLFYKLQEKGIYTFFVNQTEEEISLKERVNSAKKQNATLFISYTS